MKNCILYNINLYEAFVISHFYYKILFSELFGIQHLYNSIQ